MRDSMVRSAILALGLAGGFLAAGVARAASEAPSLTVSELIAGLEAEATIDCGQPNVRVLLLADTSPGPTDLPHGKRAYVGFSADLLVFPESVSGPDGIARVKITVPDSYLHLGRLWHVQGFLRQGEGSWVPTEPRLRRVRAGRNAKSAPYPRLFTLGFQGHFWSQGAKPQIEAEHNSLVIWSHLYGNRMVSLAKERYPGTYFVATAGNLLTGNPDSGQNQSPPEFYLRNSQGKAMTIGSNEQFFFNSSRYGAMVGGETAAQNAARSFLDHMNVPNSPWDGIGHDWLWLEMYESDTDFNRNGINDAHEGLDKRTLHRESQRAFLEALDQGYRDRTGRAPVTYYNNGAIEDFATDLISGGLAEGLMWGGHWYHLFSKAPSWSSERPMANAFGMLFTLMGEAFREGERNFVPYEVDATRSSHTAMNFYKNVQNNFRRMRFGLTLALTTGSYFSYDFHEHNMAWYYDEYLHTLGQPISDAVQIHLGPQPQHDSQWTEDTGCAFIRFFENGISVHYAPTNDAFCEVTVTEDHLEAAALEAGVNWSQYTGDGHVYRILGNQAPITVLKDDSSPTTTVSGNWKVTARSDWNNAGISLWGRSARLKDPGNGSGSIKWSLRVPRTDRYRVYATMAHAGTTPLSGTLTYSGLSSRQVATNAHYIVSHAGGTTDVRGDQNGYRGILLGEYEFQAGQDYSVELKDDANGVLYADGIWLCSVDAAFNDGSQFDQVTLYGGPSSLDNLDQHPAYVDIAGDGIVLAKQPKAHSVEPIIIGNYAYQDTWPGVKEAKYQGNWSDFAAPETSDPALDNPYWATLVWNGYLDNIGAVHAFGHKEASPNSGATATYQPKIRTAGYYHVYEWHGFRGTLDTDTVEATRVPWTLKVAGETRSSGFINQNEGKGRWNYLGTYWLPKGEQAELTLSTDGADAPVISDAVKFEYLGKRR
ncbi:MAG: hypothetical protein RL885_25910 [Planctomycetota bacterium]